MIKPKHQIQNNNPSQTHSHNHSNNLSQSEKTKMLNSMIRKPSLPIRRTSSAQSNNFSDHSCMSDRIVYKKNINEEKEK